MLTLITSTNERYKFQTDVSTTARSIMKMGAAMAKDIHPKLINAIRTQKVMNYVRNIVLFEEVEFDVVENISVRYAMEFNLPVDSIDQLTHGSFEQDEVFPVDGKMRGNLRADAVRYRRYILITPEGITCQGVEGKCGEEELANLLLDCLKSN